MPHDLAAPTRRERAAARRARRRRRQGAVAAGMLVVPLAVTAWGVQQPRPVAPGAAAEGTAGARTLTTAVAARPLLAASLARSPVNATDQVTDVRTAGAPAARTANRAAPATPGAPAVGAAGAAAPPAVRPVVARGSGRLAVAPGGTRRSGTGPLLRYSVEVEEGTGEDTVAFARMVDATLADPRSWGAGARLAFQRVSRGPVDFRVTLASPATTDRLCAPLDTDGIYSCHNEGRAVINGMRWARGAEAYGRDLTGYRRYVVNHEVGHFLGHGHEGCTAPGSAAPVMMQQTIGVGACRPDPWPYAAG